MLLWISDVACPGLGGTSPDIELRKLAASVRAAWLCPWQLHVSFTDHHCARRRAVADLLWRRKYHVQALARALHAGRVGACTGGGKELRNIDVAGMICDLVNKMATPLPDRIPRRHLISWSSSRPFETALRQTTKWYLANESWWRPLQMVASKWLGIVR